MDHFLEQDFSLLFSSQLSEDLLYFRLDDFDIRVSSFYKPLQIWQFSQLVVPLVVEPREIYNQFLVDEL
jgi:hypothetical protein